MGELLFLVALASHFSSIETGRRPFWVKLVLEHLSFSKTVFFLILI